MKAIQEFVKKTLLGVRSLFEPRFKILAYHGIPDENPSLYEVSTSQFRKQMQILRDLGFTIQDLHGAVQSMRQDGIKNKTIVITFDDALENISRNALPIMNDFGFTATVFVPTGLVGGYDTSTADSYKKERIMTWEMLKDLTIKGFSLGSHSVTHRNMIELDPQSLRDEFEQSYCSLVEKFGKRSYYFAYPYGLLNDEVLKAARTSPYVGALCFGSILSNWRKTDPYLLKREKILASTSLDEFKMIVDPKNDLTRGLQAYLSK